MSANMTMQVYISPSLPHYWIVAPSPLPTGLVPVLAIAANASATPVKRLHVAGSSLEPARALPSFERERILAAAEIAEVAYQAGQADAYATILRTSAEVAEQLGITPRTVLYHANRHDIGSKRGRDRLFHPTDIEELRAYVGQPPGRKRQKPE